MLGSTAIFPKAENLAATDRFHVRSAKSDHSHGSMLPDQDLNLDKASQSRLCYHYTIGQRGRESA